jgi:hypothetical protein
MSVVKLYKGTVQKVYISTAHSEFTKIVIRDRENRCILLLIDACPILTFKVGDPLTIRGVYHEKHGKETLPVIRPDETPLGFVRYNGRVLRFGN